MQPNTIQQIKSKSIIDYFKYEGINISKNGKNYYCCCPLHSEKTPSFCVNEEKARWWCNGQCKESGDVIDFVCKYKNLEKGDAIEYLCKVYKIPLPKRKQKKDKSKEESILELNNWVVEFYHKETLKECWQGRKYFLSRINDPSLIPLFKIGYALDPSESGSWQYLCDALQKAGFDLNLALHIGLLRKSAKGNLYDSFRGRLIFPIYSTSGQCIGFNTRKTQYSSCEGPKYLVSNETEVFKKSEVVYGYHLTAKEIKTKNECIHVEGVWDFLNLWRHGWKNVIPHFGSPAFIPNVDNHLVFMDPDTAGIKYSLDFAAKILKKGKMSRICEGNKDPSDFGKEDIERILNESKTWIDVFMKWNYKYHDSVEHKMIVLDRVSKELKGVSGEILYLYAKICSEVLKIPLKVVLFRMGMEDRVRYKEIFDEFNSVI